MNKKLVVLMTPLLFLACESEEEIEDIITLAGGEWVVSSIAEHDQSDLDAGEPCSGPVVDEEVLTEEFSLTLAFTESGGVTATNSFSLNGVLLCTDWDGVLINDGADCFDENMLQYNDNDTSDATVSMDTLCGWWGGQYSDGTCSGSDSQISSYSTDGDVITVTTYAGTDSAEVDNGVFSITDNILTLCLLEIEYYDDGQDDGTYYSYTATK